MGSVFSPGDAHSRIPVHLDEQEWPIVRTQGLCWVHDGRQVLDRISLTARPGTVTVLAGPPCAGKACLLRLIAGRLEPDSGEVWLGSRSLACLTPGSRRQRLVLLDEVLAMLDRGAVPGASLRECLLAKPQHGWSGWWQRLWRVPQAWPVSAAVTESLQLCDLERRADSPWLALDEAERCLAALAWAVAADAQVLLLDTVADGMQAAVRPAVQDVLRRLASGGRTVIEVVNDAADIRPYGDTILFMHEGRLLEPAAR